MSSHGSHSGARSPIYAVGRIGSQFDSDNRLALFSLESRLPVYDIKHIPSGEYRCCLTLPSGAKCPVVIAHGGSHCMSKSAAAREACRILYRRGDLDQGYNTLCAATKRQIQSFGRVTLTFKRQIELGLLTIPFRILSYVLIHSPRTCSWSVLGEAFLKFFLAAYFFSHHAFEMEGPLTTMVQSESNPAVLSSYLRSSELLESVRTRAYYTEKTANRYLCQVIGATAFFGSVNNAIKITRTLGMVFDVSTNTMENIFDIYSFYLSNLRISPAIRNNWTLGKIERVQEILEYQFSDKGLLLEAICHGVLESLSSTFQRLEFLGDAVLEYDVIDHYF
ncbi:Dicer-like protein 2 [Haplosporangium sp. Z 27]|nr:Dicer-like protein 2 [Haplosporangium sp. Z 27]